jgi:hypothetical protein
MDSYQRAPGSIAERMRDLGIRSRVGAPIIVDERVWGLALVGSRRPEPLPPDTEERIGEFAHLVEPSSSNPAGASSLPPMRHGGGRREICTTVLSSARSGWGCGCAWPKTWSPPNSARSKSSFPLSDRA